MSLSSGIKTARKKAIVNILARCLEHAILDERLYTTSDVRRTAKIMYKRIAEEIGWDDKKSKGSNKQA